MKLKMFIKCLDTTLLSSAHNLSVLWLCDNSMTVQSPSFQHKMSNLYIFHTVITFDP